MGAETDRVSPPGAGEAAAGAGPGDEDDHNTDDDGDDDGDDNDDDDNDDDDDQVAGRGGQVRWEMRDQLPYTMATLREVQRSVVVIWSLYNDNDDNNDNDPA